MMSEVRNYFGGPVFIVPLGVDLRRFRPDVDNEIVRAKYGLQNRFTLLYVGRLSHYKRVWFMIRALAALKDPSVRLVIAGEGEERGRLENYAKALEVEDQTIFLGDVSDEELPQIYAACDVFITASLHEGVCVPILEAFAAAKPALVPDLTAMPETTDGGGLVYQWDSIADLVQKVRILRADKTLRLRLGRIGLEKVARQDTARVCREYRLSLDQIVRNLSH
jgi:glycosyltransferase involved in cell wall biosynthesis